MGKSGSFTFADLCCGMGGFHLACVAAGGVCVQACDIDAGARAIYALNYGIEPEENIIKLANKGPLPAAGTLDLVCFGNPCQPFSTIGQRSGLDDKRGGKVFFAICKYLRDTRAKAFLMENVKGLAIHEDFPKMLKALRRCGYTLSVKLLNAQDFGSPQHRERVFVFGMRSGQVRSEQGEGHDGFNFDSVLKKTSRGSKILEDILDKGKPDDTLLTKRFDAFDLTSCTYPEPTKSGFRIRAQFNNYTEKRLFSTKGAVGTVLSTHSPFIFDERYKVARHLSVRELLRLQGFPMSFKIPSDILPYRKKTLKYIGNAVHVGMVKAIITAMMKQKMI